MAAHRSELTHDGRLMPWEQGRETWTATGHTFDPAHNRRWLEVTRPIVEAFFHARYFLEMAVRYGGTPDAPPRLLPSGWAAILALYDLR